MMELISINYFSYFYYIFIEWELDRNQFYVSFSQFGGDNNNNLGLLILESDHNILPLQRPLAKNLISWYFV